MQTETNTTANSDATMTLNGVIIELVSLTPRARSGKQGDDYYGVDLDALTTEQAIRLIGKAAGTDKDLIVDLAEASLNKALKALQDTCLAPAKLRKARAYLFAINSAKRERESKSKELVRVLALKEAQEKLMLSVMALHAKLASAKASERASLSAEIAKQTAELTSLIG